MINRICFLVVCLMGASLCVHAQNGLPTVAGARGLGMANAGFNFRDVNSTFSNQAGLAFMEHFSATAFAEMRFLGSGINNIAAAIAYPVKGNTLALSVQQFGLKGYNEQKIGLAYARKLFDAMSLGIQLDYIGLRIPEYGSKPAFTFEVGLQGEPIVRKLLVGAHIFSPIRVSVTDNERLPIALSAGATYLASSSLSVHAGIEKDIDFTASFKGGFEYLPSKVFAIRAGVSTQPTQPTFGFGLRLKGFALDLASAYHTDLGFSSALSATYTVSHEKPAPKTQD
jgi:hypothetical protein